MRECDMIANLMQLPGETCPEGIKIKRVYAGEKNRVLDFVRENFQEMWVNEAEYAISQLPVTCFIAVKDGEILGFSCYDTSAKGFFGPIGVKKDLRSGGVGKALLLRTLHAMRDVGYGYAIIGWVGSAAGFYEKVVNATFIPGGEPENSVYSNMIDK